VATKKKAPKAAPRKSKSVRGVIDRALAPVSTLRGLRRVEALGRQLERWQEKWPLGANAGEWLKFAAAGQAQLKLLELEARRTLGDLGPVTRMEAVRSSKGLSQAQQLMAGRVADDTVDEAD
jgi:hypothetical protein